MSAPRRVPILRRIGRALASMRWPIAIGIVGALAAWGTLRHREEAVRALPAAARPIIAIAFSMDGALIAVASEDGEIEIWDAAGGREPRVRIANPDGPARQLIFDTVEGENGARRTRLLFATALGRVRGVDARTGESALAEDAFPISYATPIIAVHPRGGILMTGVDASGASFTRVRTGERLAEVELPAEWRIERASPAAESSAGSSRRSFFVAGGDSFGLMSEVSGEAWLSSLPVRTGLPASQLSVHIFEGADSGSHVLLTGGAISDDARANIEFNIVRISEPCAGAVLAQSSDHRVVTGAGNLCAVTLEGREARTQIIALNLAPTAAAFAGGRVVLGDASGAIHIASARGRIVGRLGGHRQAVTAIAVSPDGRRAASGAADGSIQVFDLGPARAEIYAAPAALAAGARGAVERAWPAFINRIAPLAVIEEMPDFDIEVAGALAGAWAPRGQCEDPTQAIFFDVQPGGMGVTVNGRRSVHEVIAAHRSGSDAIVDLNGPDGAVRYMQTGAQWTRTGGDALLAPIVACAPTIAWIDWLRSIPQAAMPDEALEAAAARLGVEADALRAVAIVESGADAFAARPTIAIEYFPHLFSRGTNRRFDASNPEVSRPTWDPTRTGAQADHWRWLREAAALDLDAAVAATAWGPFKILAGNYAQAGTFSPMDFAVAQATVPGAGAATLEAFILSTNLADELQRRDWAGFARGYNGPGQVERYAGLMAAAYEGIGVRRDPDAFLQSLTGDATRAGAAPFTAAAARLNVDPLALRAVADVLGAGEGFGADRRVRALFDPGTFSRLSEGRYDQSNARVSNPNGRPVAQNGRWEELREALALDPDVALQSTAWGMFALRGRNFAGAGAQSAIAMVRQAARSEAEQVAQFERFIRWFGLADELQRLDWPAFARGYLTVGDAANAERLAAAYARLGGTGQAAAAPPTDAPAPSVGANGGDPAWIDTLRAQTRAPLTRADFEASAQRLNAPWQALAAVAEVMSGPLGGFAADGFPIILYERHLFSRFTSRVYDESHPSISNRTPGGYPRTQAERWAQVRAAYALDAEAALRSTSYGRFQILGSQHATAGFSDARSYVAFMSQSEVNQLVALEGFIRTNNLADELQRLDWAGFARVFNGPGYAANQYDRKLADAYARLTASAIP